MSLISDPDTMPRFPPIKSADLLDKIRLRGCTEQNVLENGGHLAPGHPNQARVMAILHTHTEEKP